MGLSCGFERREFGDRNDQGYFVNDSRRKNLKRALSMLESASQIINMAAEQEQDSLDNLPENLQGSDRCEKMEDAVSFLESAIEDIDSASDKIRDAAV